MTELIKEIIKEVVDTAKKVREEGFQDMDLEEIQKLPDFTSEELTEDDLLERTAPEPEPDPEKDGAAVPENKLTSDNLAQCSD